MRDIIKIEGGHRLNGEVRVSGSKNATVALIPAAVLAGGPVTISGVPGIADVNSLSEILRMLNCDVTEKAEHLIIDPTNMKNTDLDAEVITKLRASYYFMGALLGKYGYVRMKMPGGCYLGPRPIDLHIKGFEALGAKVEYEKGCYTIQADELKGAKIFLDISSVGATINIMLAAVKAEGQTVIENAAKEPHIVDLANFLNSMGAQIRGAGTDTIKIRGVDFLHGVNYSIIPDQIEAGTYMCAAAATRGRVLVKNVTPKHLESITAKLREIGCEIKEFDEAVLVDATKRPLNRCNIKTMPHPGFPTDCQPQFAVLLATVDGTSIINESVWDNRYQYVSELTLMNAHISVEGRLAIIEGGSRLTAAPVKATDLRAGAAMIIAGLCADGTTEVSSIQYIERGYEDIVEKLTNLGADIKKVYYEESRDRSLRA